MARGGDPLKDPKYLRAKARVQQGQQARPHGKPQNATAQRQAEKLVKETERNAAKQAADKPKYDAAVARQMRRQELYRVDRRIRAAVDRMLTAGDVDGAQRVIDRGKAAAQRANQDRVCTKCNGTKVQRSWGKEIPCKSCKGTGKKQWWQ